MRRSKSSGAPATRGRRRPKTDDQTPGTTAGGWLTGPGFHRLALVLLVALPALVYANTLRNDYHLDDDYRIVGNPELERVWPPWRHFFDRTTGATLPSLAQYRPLLPLSLSLNHWLSDRLGVDRLAGLHAGNILIHLLSTVLLYLLFRELIAFFEPERAVGRRAVAPKGRQRHTGAPKGRQRKTRAPEGRQWQDQASFFAALIFAVHPVSGVPVNYLSKRDVLLMQLFLAAAWLIYVRLRAAGRTSPVGVAAVVGLLAMSLLAREEGVTGVLVILCFELLGPGAMRRLRGPFPVLLLLAAVAAVVWRGTWFLDQISFRYALVQLKVHLWTYLADAVWPLRVRLLPEIQPVASVLDPAMLSGLVLVLASFYLAWRWRVQRPLASFCILAYWALLAPTSSVIALTELATPYRQYPSLAFLGLLAAVVTFTAVRFKKACFALAYAVLFFSLASYTHNKAWRDDRSLWARNVRHGGTATAHLNYGRSLLESDPARAEAHFLLALEREPDNYFVLINLGLRRLDSGRTEDGLADLRKAVRIRPGRALAHYWLAEGYRRVGRPQAALAERRRAADLQPDNAEYQYRAARDLLERRDAAAALVYLQRLAERIPDYRDVLFLEGSALDALGRWRDAEARYLEFLELRPNRAAARLSLASGLANEGRCSEAVGEAERVLEADPRLAPPAHRLLAKCHQALGDAEAAARHAELAQSGSGPQKIEE